MTVKFSSDTSGLDSLDIKNIFKTLPKSMIFRGNFSHLKPIKNPTGTVEPEAQLVFEAL